MADLPQEHSPLGASGMHRWDPCPGSVGLSEGIVDPESEFAAEGTAAHELAAYCLSSAGEPWEHIGQHYHKGRTYPEHWARAELPEGAVEVTKDMADAVQVFVDHVRYNHPDANQGNFFVERSFHCPEIHELFYGTADVVYFNKPGRELHVYDYKHGAGIVVDVKENVQLMYYATGALQDLGLWDDVDRIVLHIAQPRGWHHQGPLRHWAISVEDLEAWMEEVLIPSMDRALTSRDVKSGEHCRFCPARKNACPQLIADMEEMEKLMAHAVKKGGAKELTNTQIGRFLVLHETSKIFANAAKETAFGRLSANEKIPGYKLARARTNRDWRDGAEDKAKKLFGAKALRDPEMRSPAKMEELPGGIDFTTEYAFKPEGGMAVVAEKDARVAVDKDPLKMFPKEKK